jgi:signal transduction histidine kinase
MHGYPEGGLDGRSVRELIAPERQGQLDDFMRELEQSPSISLESVDVRSDGSRLDVEVRGSRFMHGGRPALLAVVRDLTGRRMAMEQLAMLSSKVLVAQEEERARLSRDLHDGLGQTLTALRFELDWLAKKAGQSAELPSFEQATGLLQTSAQELRRICRGLRPSMLDDLGLESAARQLVEEFEEHSAITAELVVAMDEEAPPIESDKALCAYRVLQEALTNVNRHSKATSVRVELVADRTELRISVEDDGKGFEASNGKRLTHLGIAGMRERSKLAHGTLELHSEVGKGTRVVLRVPLVPTPLPEALGQPTQPNDDDEASGESARPAPRPRGEP